MPSKTETRRTAERPGEVAGGVKSAFRAGIVAAVLSLVVLFAMPSIPAAEDSISLTSGERQWLAAHPTIAIAPHPDFQPMESLDENGRYQGIAADYIARFEQMLGVRFRIVRLSNWTEILEAAKSRRIDMLGAAAATPPRSEYMLFTSPFVEVPCVIIVRKNVEGTLTLDKLSGMRVAAVSGFASHEYLQSRYPDVAVDPVPNVQTGLRKVSFAIADALVANLATATHYIEREGITNLRLAGETDWTYSLAFAVRKDWPELAAIIDKALAGIGRDERDAIYRKWVRLDRDIPFSHSELWIAVGIVFGAVCLVVVGLLLWNQVLKSLVDERTRELSGELAERKLAEESLRRAEARYRGIFENAVEGIYQSTPMGQYNEVNPAFARIFGYDSPEEVKLAVRDIATQLYGNPHQRAECIRIVEERGASVFEVEIKRKDGSTGWVSNNVRAVRDFDGNITHFEGVVEDVTELKQAAAELQKARNELARKVEERTAALRVANEELQREILEHESTQEALRAAHQQLRDIIEFLPDATLVVDREKRVIAWNRAMEEMTGAKKEDMLGKGERAYAVPFYGEPAPTLIDMVVDGRIYQRESRDIIGRRGDTVYGEGYISTMFEGRGAYLWAIASPLFDADGNVIGAVESIRDITHRKRAESELKESEKRLKDLSARLLTAQEEERKRMARDVHDSLGSVLTGVKISLENMYGDIMRGKAGSQSIDDLIALTRHAMRECRRIITDLRPSVLDDYGIAVTVGWLCRQFQRIHPDISIVEKVDINEDEIQDSLKIVIFRIMQEALNNIGKHSGARLANLSLAAIGDRIELSIEDDGVGFAVDELSTKSGSEKGLGLAGMRERTELSGGTFLMRSIPGQGTRIEAQWPRSAYAP